MDAIKDWFTNLKQQVTNFTADSKRTVSATKDVKASLADVQSELPAVQDFVKDVQVQVEKMNFKNKPRLERITEAQTRIQDALNTLKKH
ncbi:hypothetical protein C6P08_06335 [Weissella confusa]|uniref:hypothetical protein n=1 Tax=Weissella confusa TaxID=1583 RepID=UPI0010932B59|nr:hypothetical protein [Weissella confusa]MBJ7694418.1 hypothetical protein [Weissella confusa]QBZ04818.1 hypothetical protein C6P08_06335 [Weissella confusa]